MSEKGDKYLVRQKAAEVKHLVKTYGARGFQTKVLKGID